jgi:2-polyprenyl-3-methyl-5-hydroxy-6-metoxy-1,4-benzoquinol methylase
VNERTTLEIFRELLEKVDRGDEILQVPHAISGHLDAARQAVDEVGRMVEGTALAEYFKTSTNRYAHYLASASALLPRDAAILDVGNAPGHVAIGLHLMGFHDIQGINLNAEWRALYPTPEWLETFKVLEHDVERDPLPFADDSFDAVLFTEVLEHIAVRDPVWVVLEMRRVLRPGGRVIFSTPNVCNISNMHALMMGKNIFWDPGMFYGSLDRHNREYTITEVTSCFRNAGLGQEYLWGINDHSNWRSGGNDFAYAYTARYGDDHVLTRNTTLGVYKK